MMTSSSEQSGGTDGGAGRPSAMAGRTVGDYQILREIGRGGMAVVYEARQRSLDRLVALKILTRTSVLTESAVTRFRREAQAAAKLHHPNIVPIFAQGEEDGIHYYAMELVKGRTVHQAIWARRGVQQSLGLDDSSIVSHSDTDETVFLGGTPGVGSSDGLPNVPPPGPSDATRWAIEEFDTIARRVATVADALEYAHQQGVIHRDIKPHNLMIGHDGRVAVADFGLARIVEQPGMTITGEFLGSPLYMSPEQIMSGQSRVDHRTDIYSLGATLYEWLTLAPPFPGETRELVISRIINSDPTPPRSQDSRVPVDLETICLKALEKDPARRYASAAEMRDDLHRYLGRRSIRARRVSAVTRVKKFLLRNRVAAMAGLAVVIVVTSATALYQQSKETQQSEVEHQATVNERDARIAAVEQERSELVEQKEQWEQDKEAFLKAVAETIVDISKPVLASAEGEKELAYKIAASFASSTLNELRQAEGVRLESRPPDDRPEPAEEYYLSAIASDDFAVALAMVNQSLNEDGDYFSARLLRAIFSCSIRNYGAMFDDGEALIAVRPQAYQGFMIRGAARLFMGRATDALLDLQRAIEKGGDTAWLHTLSGLGRYRQKYYASANRDFTRALAVDSAHVEALMGRAQCFYEVQNYNAGIADASRVIELDPNHIDAYLLRGGCYDRLERYDESIEDYVRANTLADGSLAILARIQWAQANKLQKEQTTRDDVAQTHPASDEAPPEPPPDEQRDALREVLDRLRDTSPDHRKSGVSVPFSQVSSYLRIRHAKLRRDADSG